MFVDASGAACSMTLQLSLHKASDFLLGPQSNLFCHVIHKPKGAIYQPQMETPEPHAQEDEGVWALESAARAVVPACSPCGLGKSPSPESVSSAPEYLSSPSAVLGGHVRQQT